MDERPLSIQPKMDERAERAANSVAKGYHVEHLPSPSGYGTVARVFFGDSKNPDEVNAIDWHFIMQCMSDIGVYRQIIAELLLNLDGVIPYFIQGETDSLVDPMASVAALEELTKALRSGEMGDLVNGMRAMLR